MSRGSPPNTGLTIHASDNCNPPVVSHRWGRWHEQIIQSVKKFFTSAMIPITYFIHIYSIRMSTSRDSKLKQLYRRKFYGRNNIIYVHREQFNRNPKNYSRFIKQFVHDIITSISWYLQVINFLYYYHYSRCIMKIILLYTRHWTTDVGPLKWFGQNCTTELATIQQVCTRVLQIKIVLLCNYFLQGSWWNAQRYFKPVSFHSVWDVET